MHFHSELKNERSGVGEENPRVAPATSHANRNVSVSHRKRVSHHHAKAYEFAVVASYSYLITCRESIYILVWKNLRTSRT